MPIPATHPPPPTVDPERLAALDAYDILDTPPEEGFDDIVQLAASVCAVPVALVSLVAADRQWFKAHVGFAPCETDLNSSVCAHALSAPDLLVIPDLTKDPRTSGNPLVTDEPQIRFYAGAPLRTPEGRVLGSLCVIDASPRPQGLNADQADNLRRLARQVMALMHERRQLRRLQLSEERLSDAFTRQAALTEIGDHLRDLSTLSQMASAAAEIVGRTLEASRAGYGELDATGNFIDVLSDWTTPGSASLSGRHSFADYGRIGPVIRRGDTLVISDVDTDPRTAANSGLFRGLNIQAMVNVPIRERGRTVALIYVHSAKARQWSPEEVGFARNVADRVLAGLARLRAEEHQDTLNRELSHRMKNTLAMVQAIAAQTLRNAPNLETAREALSARLISMGRAHDILLNGSRTSAGLDEVIRGALTIHDDAQEGRFRIEGPFVKVGSKAALSLALMIHELATNAAKYGALSTSHGCVKAQWSVVAEQQGPTVHLRWSEHEGPRVTKPTRRGFGSRLIERSLTGAIDAKVALSYPPEGAVCELSATLAGIEADE